MAAQLTDSQLSDLCAKFRAGVDIRDRKYLTKTYPQCFVGEEAVTWLVNNAGCANRKEALVLGQQIMNKGVFRHVVGQHAFKDKFLFYNLLPDLSPKTLLDRLGGSKALAVLVDDVVDRLKTDIVLAMNPFLKMLLVDPKSMAAHKFVMWELLSSVTGGGNSVDHLDIGEAHKRFKISDAEWDSFMKQVKAAMDKLAVPDKEQGELLALITGFKDEVVTKPSLYERIGGAVAVSCVVDDFMNEASKHPVLLANPKVKDGFVRVPLPGLKYLVTEFVCSAIGGPQKYSGLSMKQSHANMEITDTEWSIFADLIRSTLTKFRVPHAELDELMNVVSSLRGEIVKPSGLARSLYDRIGGLGGLVIVCDHLADMMKNDLSLNANQAVLNAHTKLTTAGYRNIMVQALSQVLGGPHKYPKFLFDTHKGLHITDKEFNQFLFLLESALQQGKISNRDIIEIVNLVAGLKSQIVVA